MSRRPLDREMYEALAAAYREHPGNYNRAGALARVDRRTARKAWHDGWPGRTWARPLKDVVGEEQLAARAKLDAEKAQIVHEAAKQGNAFPVAVQTAARTDAVDARVQETRLVRGARENSLALIAGTQGLLRGALKLSQKLQEAIANSDMTPAKGVNLVAAVARLVRDGNESAKLALTLERMLVGAPTEIIGIQNITLEDAEQELEAARRALALVREDRDAGG